MSPAFETQFIDVVMDIAKRHGFETQADLAERVGKKQAYLSLIGSGKRKLTPALAVDFEDAMEGSSSDWMAVANAIGTGSNLPTSFFTSQITKDMEHTELLGVEARRLRKQAILDLFGNPNISEHRMFGETEACWIKNFDESRLDSLTYDASAKFAKDHLGERESFAGGAMTLNPGQSLLFYTEEIFCMPSWIEVDVHPPYSLANKFLLTGNGPIIDPVSFEGRLQLLVHNPLPCSVKIKSSDSDFDAPI